jgi:hypothetical protein
VACCSANLPLLKGNLIKNNSNNENFNSRIAHLSITDQDSNFLLSAGKDISYHPVMMLLIARTEVLTAVTRYKSSGHTTLRMEVASSSKTLERPIK